MPVYKSTGLITIFMIFWINIFEQQLHYNKINYWINLLCIHCISKIIINPSLYLNPNIYYSKNNNTKELYCIKSINLYKNGLKIYGVFNHLTDCYINSIKEDIYKELKFILIEINEIN